MTLGKDETPFSLFRYEDWVKRGPSHMKFEKFKRQKQVPRVICEICFEGPFMGRAIAQHRKTHCDIKKEEEKK